MSVSTFSLTSPIINHSIVSVGRLRNHRWRPTALFGFYATLIAVFRNMRQTGDLLIFIVFFFIFCYFVFCSKSTTLHMHRNFVLPCCHCTDTTWKCLGIVYMLFVWVSVFWRLAIFLCFTRTTFLRLWQICSYFWRLIFARFQKALYNSVPAKWNTTQ